MRNPYDRQTLRWNGWGPSDHEFSLGEREPAFWNWVAGELGGADLSPRTPATLDEIRIRVPQLKKSTRAELVAVLGEEHVRQDRYERVFHAVGRSYRDLLSVRRGEIDAVPDAVLYPHDSEQVAAILKICARDHVAVVPFGGGSSVVGGVEPRRAKGQRAVVTLDTTRMNRVLSVDPISHTAVVQTGIYGPELESALQARGFTLGHYPQSFQFSTLGGWIAARGAGQQSNGYGVAAKWLVSARVVTPEGEMVTQPFPNSAAGPDLNHLIAGSEGRLGVITEATVRLHDVPASRDYQGVFFRDFVRGSEALREMIQQGLSVAMVRLSDGDETQFLTTFSRVGTTPSRTQRFADALLERRGFGEETSLMLIGVEGERAHCAWTMARALAIAVKHGGLPLGPGIGKKWYEGRFNMPYLREPMMDRGVGVDTLETSTTWGNIFELHRQVGDALRAAIIAEGAPDALVMCHISHSYDTGASLYFTFAFPIDERDPLRQWRRIKTAASDAIRDFGGTISHHHGVGADHLPWMADEKGAGQVDALSALSRAFDPAGILNPGKTFPDEG